MNGIPSKYCHKCGTVFGSRQSTDNKDYKPILGSSLKKFIQEVGLFGLSYDQERSGTKFVLENSIEHVN